MATILGFVVSENCPQSLIISTLVEIIAKNTDKDMKPLQ
jgi:hypothetical protein